MSKCVYCTEDVDGYVTYLPREGEGNAALHYSAARGPVLVIRGPHKMRVEIPVNFCPMCGRDLKKKATPETKRQDFILTRIPQEELLAQLAEEAAELTHAALKLRRVLNGTNPTPVSSMDALQAIKEEIADVTLLVQLLGLDYNGGEIEQIKDRKLRRWVSRLEGSLKEEKQSEGTWEKSDLPGEKYVCSVCGGACWYYDYQGDVAKSKFCPNCGAKMKN